MKRQAWTTAALCALALCAPVCGADGKGESWLPKDFKLLNLPAPPPMVKVEKVELPVVVPPFPQHVRGAAEAVDSAGATGLRLDAQGAPVLVRDPKPVMENGETVNAEAETAGSVWRGTDKGLYRKKPGGGWEKHESYGVDGPPASKIKALAADSAGNLWVGTPAGLGVLSPDGAWRIIRGGDGLPVEQITALAADGKGGLWIGTPAGAIYHAPNAADRKWFYRAGPRYLPGDDVRAAAVTPDGDTAWFLTDAGLGRIDTVTTTLLEKAQSIEKRLNERHRRGGMVAAALLDDAHNPGAHEIHDNDNDGLWTAYHVAAMSLAFAATGDEAARASAREGMHALYLLQNVSGIPGLVARSVVTPEVGKTKSEQWRPSPDGKWYWKSDTSSDEIDGHYLAFYAYYEHVARHDPAEKSLIEKQVRALTDHLTDNGYQLIDWDGKRTTWGFWDPKSLNHSPSDYIEAGLNSLQILSFLKTAHHVTGDKKYEDHYRSLILEHHYLDNILMTKKSFPDENNHSDDQLGYVAWYPILQLEKDTKIRRALVSGVRRHYEIVRPEHSSFFAFVTATAAPGIVDILGAVENLRQIPEDRRDWRMVNSHRADVTFAEHPERFGKPVLTRVLPADERAFMKWNHDPYLPDGGGDGRVEDDGAAWLLPYWMGRHHGFIAEQ